MKAIVWLLPILACVTPVLAGENRTEKSPLTMEQLMRELQLQGGNFAFHFEKPVYARVTTEVGEKDSGQPQTHHFSTESPQTNITLRFTAGRHLLRDSRDRFVQMKIKLSHCKETDGTRIVSYEDKLPSDAPPYTASYEPDIPIVPELGKPYVLHWYFKEGHPYFAKATIEFSETAFR